MYQEKVEYLVMERLALDTPPKPNDSFIDVLEADSLDLVELLSDIQREFDVRFSDEEKAGMRDIATVLAVLNKKVR